MSTLNQFCDADQLVLHALGNELDLATKLTSSKDTTIFELCERVKDLATLILKYPTKEDKEAWVKDLDFPQGMLSNTQDAISVGERVDRRMVELIGMADLQLSGKAMSALLQASQGVAHG